MKLCVCDLISGMKPEKEWTDWIELKDRVQPTVVTLALPFLCIGGPDRQDIFSTVNTNATKGVSSHSWPAGFVAMPCSIQS